MKFITSTERDLIARKGTLEGLKENENLNRTPEFVEKDLEED